MNGFILYRGPSVLDGAPIVCIVTGLENNSQNAKTGSLVQTWILRDDMSPVEATSTGADAAICGSCPHRGRIIDGRNVGRSCYVAVFQAPLTVYRAHQRGVYPAVTPKQARALLAGRKVRIGSYGDGAAVPFKVWKNALAGVEACTGYTHQWRGLGSPLKAYCMASCDNAADYAEAKALGWRTFRVRTAGEALNAREIACPASKEAGQKTTCAACVACGGASAKARVDIAIVAHGAAVKVNAFNARNA